MKDCYDSSPLVGTSRHDVKGLRGMCRVDRVLMQEVVTDRRFLLHYCGNPQERIDLSQIAGVPGSIARLQSSHQAVSSRCPRPACVPEDSQEQGTLARQPSPMRAAD